MFKGQLCILFMYSGAAKKHGRMEYEMKKRNIMAAFMMAMAMAAALPAAAFAGETETLAEGTALGGETTEQAENSESEAAEQAEDDESEMAEQAADGEDSMAPVYGEDLADGVYEVEALLNPSLFPTVGCELTVKEGEMTAVMTVSSGDYKKLFLGSKEEAAEVAEEACIPLQEKAKALQTCTVPVEALNTGIGCAAWSQEKEAWEECTLVFLASSLPGGALQNVSMTSWEDLGLEDGAYLVDVTMEGGSGRSSIQSPVTLTVKDGEMTATIVWGSPFYDYMVVGGEKYLPVNTEGDSTFEIPVDGLDYKMPVTGDTVAMSIPHEIDYTLYFDSASVREE